GIETLGIEGLLLAGIETLGIQGLLLAGIETLGIEGLLPVDLGAMLGSGLKRHVVIVRIGLAGADRHIRALAANGVLRGRIEYVHYAIEILDRRAWVASAMMASDEFLAPYTPNALLDLFREFPGELPRVPGPSLTLRMQSGSFRRSASPTSHPWSLH